MTLPFKSILSCLLILAMASDIHTQQIRELKPSQQLAKGIDKSLVWGIGVERDQLPIITYPLTTGPLDVSVYITQPRKQCNFTFSFDKGTNGVIEPGKPSVDEIRQLGLNRILIQWSLLLSLRGQWDTLVTTMSILDMRTCINKKVVEFDFPSSVVIRVVAFVNGFDVFTSRNSHARYDINGNLIDKIEPFPLNCSIFSIRPVSVESRTNGFFIADYDNKALNLVKADGTLVQHLLKPMLTEVDSDNDQSLYSACSIDSHFADVVNCFQCDERGTVMWKNKAKLPFSPERLDVKNLKGGGLVFAAHKTWRNQLGFVEMGPKQFSTWSYSAKHPFQTIRLMDFNENERTFVLAYEIIKISEHEDFVDSMTLQKYSLV